MMREEANKCPPMEKMVSGDDLVNTSPVSVVNVFKSSKLLFFVITFCAYSRAFSQFCMYR